MWCCTRSIVLTPPPNASRRAYGCSTPLTRYWTRRADFCSGRGRRFLAAVRAHGTALVGLRAAPCCVGHRECTVNGESREAGLERPAGTEGTPRGRVLRNQEDVEYDRGAQR